MKKYHKIFSLFAGLLILSIAVSCEAGMFSSYYTTMEQPAGESEQIKSSTEFKIKPIDFSAIKPQDLGYKNSEEWDADRSGVPQAFAEAFPILLKEAKVDNKKVTMLAGNEKVNKGIIVEVAVTKIILNWNFMSAKPDEFICKITFTNADDGQKLFSATVNVNSRSGNPFAQGWKASFSNRLNIASYNIAWVLTKIMVQGKINPADY